MTATSVHTWYLSLVPPPGTPPNWAFGPVWTVLYVMIGVAAWQVWRRIGGGRTLRIWGWQLILNAAWPPAFFGLRSLPLGLATILVMLAAILLTIRAFARFDRAAALLMVPYAAWVAYVTYLNAGFLWLNPGR